MYKRIIDFSPTDTLTHTDTFAPYPNGSRNPVSPPKRSSQLEAPLFFAYFSVGEPHPPDGYLTKFSSESITDKL